MERTTQQRTAIRKVFGEIHRPLSPQEVLDRAAVHCPGLGIATVYRNLRALQGEGWLVPVEIPGEPPRYEVAGKPHHHHFHCQKCNRVFEVEGCPGNIKPLLPKGFQLTGHELILFGLCRDCSAPAPRKRQRASQ